MVNKIKIIVGMAKYGLLLINQLLHMSILILKANETTETITLIGFSIRF